MRVIVYDINENNSVYAGNQLRCLTIAMYSAQNIFITYRKIILNEVVNYTRLFIKLLIVAFDINSSKILKPGRRRNQQNAIECSLRNDHFRHNSQHPSANSYGKQ